MRKLSKLTVAFILMALTFTMGMGMDTQLSPEDVTSSITSNNGDPIHI